MPNYVYQQPRTFFSCAFFPQNRHGQPTWYQGWALTKKLTRWQATRLHTTAARLRLEVRAYAWCGVAYPSPPCNLSSMTFPLKNTRARIYLEGYLFYLASKCTVTPSTSIDGSSLTAYTLMAPTHSSECQPSSKLYDPPQPRYLLLTYNPTTTTLYLYSRYILTRHAYKVPRIGLPGWRWLTEANSNVAGCTSYSFLKSF